MAQGTGILTEVRYASPMGARAEEDRPTGRGQNNLRSGQITCPASMRPGPGQYLVASSADPAEPLPVVLFPSGIDGDELCLAPPLPRWWEVGMRVTLRGPLGNGFHLPPLAQRVALAAFDFTPDRLLPLAYQALSRHAAVALYTQSAPASLPKEVEVLPLDLLNEAPTWADYIALDLPHSDLAAARAALGLGLYARVPCPTQALILTPMPCSGLADCGVCAVYTPGGWRLTCSDGPVFDFNALEVT